MPAGIIMSSGSQGATQEAIAKVLADNGYEADKPKAAVEEAVEPKRDDFKSDEELEQAQEEFEAAKEEAEAKREEEEEESARRGVSKTAQRRQRAIDNATRELKEELRKANERLAALEGKSSEKKDAKVEEPRAPKREDFETDEEFEDAKFDYRYKLRRAKEELEQAKTSIEQQREEHWAGYKSNLAAVREKHADFDEVVSDKIKISEAVYEAIVRLEDPSVTYYLGKHPEVAERLNRLDPVSAVVEIGRLAERLKTKAPELRAEKSNKPKPRLPEPVKPVSTAATSSTLTSAEAAKKKDFKAFKQAQRSGR